MDDYDIVVVPKELLEPPHFSKIHCLDISRIEFVVDNDCYLYCKFMGQMYRYLGQLNKVEPYGKVYDLIYDKTCLSDCHLGDENFAYWYSHQKLQELIDMGFVRFKIARHEEYPIERLVEQWQGYFVDYNKPDVDPEKWKRFWERGKNLPLNSKRNIINE